MGLPKIELPLFEVEIPSTKQKVKYRPFTVKEEKILLIAQESGELSQIVLAVKQIIQNCVYDIDVEKLAVFDLEYILLNLRIKSVNNAAKFNVTDPDTDETVELELDLENIKILKKEEITPNVYISDESYLVMRYPSINEVLLLQKEESGEKDIIDIMVSCIDNIVNGEEVFKTEDFTQQEMYDFLESLPSTVIGDIENFFSNMPSLRHEIKYKNSEGNEKTFVIEGLNSFFL